MKISGFTMVKNAFDLDYCFEECIKSMLDVCDEVVVSDGESSDGTQEFLREWVDREPKLKLCVYAWPAPKGDIEFFVKWIQYTREHCSGDFILQLDADEVLHEVSYAAIKSIRSLNYPQYFSVWCDRLNFYKDHYHLIPHGECLGHRVVRIAPQNVWLPSDGCHHNGAEAVGMARDWGFPIRIFHYGFLRKPSAYFKKSRALHQYFFNNYDYRLEAVENDPNWMTNIKDVEWINRLVTYSGDHPAIMKDWLKERGYE